MTFTTEIKIANPANAPNTPIPSSKESFHHVPETMFLTLSTRADDARRSTPILNDTWAAQILDNIDYHMPRRLLDWLIREGVLIRAWLLDSWATSFLDRNPEAVVLHLACGLDSRVLRLKWGPGVTWVDLDLPEVIALRQKLVPSPNDGRDYRLVAASATDTEWLDDIPTDRPVLIIMEGFVMYLNEPQAKQLLNRLSSKFSRGEVIFDVVGHLFTKGWILGTPAWTATRLMKFVVNDQKELEKMVPGMKVKVGIKYWEYPVLDKLPWFQRTFIKALKWIPGFWMLISAYKFQLGSED
ncbi:S-adenosyl-L-methionine-dependent methyltransferase dpfgK [Cladobotryum mycophilum]|uniref:S-adenosyl-L-methionine-dependent methyltransferase dpfgK n=1 Tax=Cladobotryum mycophilum TaxID=491253 RepID=A0ABR0SSJ6_9HYPO